MAGAPGNFDSNRWKNFGEEEIKLTGKLMGRLDKFL